MSKHIELAKKLKALADRGVGGEKFNAERALKNLMAKHGFTFEDLENEYRSFNYFKVAKASHALFHQVAASVIGKERPTYHSATRAGFLIETTAAEAIEIESKFDFYRKAYKEELKTFYRAFIAANNLWPKDSEGIKKSEMSEEEIQARIKAERMAAGMEAHAYLKRLGKH